jgi:N-methylhydantoinase A/oxoprolinase/acetone carboxylase beta subunit
VSLRIGIDVGGTNTDAVVLDGRTVIADTKSPTTDDVTSGIQAALAQVLGHVDPNDVDSVFIGTTHFINAIAQARGLEPVAVVRLATPPQSLLPMIDWPDRLRAAIGEHVYVCPGGAQFDGRELSPLDEARLAEIARDIKAAGLRHVALSSVFSVVNPEAEIRAEQVLRGELGADVTITRSATVGRVGLLERENATILNATLLDLAGRIIDRLEKVVADAGLAATVLLCQNDGTVMTLDKAREFPIFTIASGPTNSMRGASMLTDIRDAIVIDVGGTTTDIGLMQHGFPRESTVAMELAGVRTNFHIPDVISRALGGGTMISRDGREVGPQSVGYRIADEALVFGGNTLTFTDVAVAGGAPPVGDVDVTGAIEPATVTAALDVVSTLLINTIERARLSADDTPIIAVGGGAPLLAAVPGLELLVIPDKAGVANAVGAAVAEAGGEVDRVYALDGRTRADIVAEAKQEAIGNAIAAGAAPDGVRIIDVEDVPLTHLPGGGAVHVRVKAVGPFILGAEHSEGR